MGQILLALFALGAACIVLGCLFSWRLRRERETQGIPLTGSAEETDSVLDEEEGVFLWPPELSGLARFCAEGHQEDVEIISCDAEWRPAAVKIIAHTPETLAEARACIQESPRSFVVSDGQRYRPGKEVEPDDPTRPADVDELSLEFDVEYVGTDDGLPCIYLFAYTQHEWEQAIQAVRHLLAQKQLSPQSCLELDKGGTLSSLEASDLEAHPAQESVALARRERAYQRQNSWE